MPMVWNNDSSTKLLFGILAQIRESSIKLDYAKLAQYMGPECTVSAIRSFMSRQSSKVVDGPSADKSPENGSAAKKSKAPRAPRKPRTPKKRKLNEINSEDAEPEFESEHENTQKNDAQIKIERDFEESTSSLREDDMLFASVKVEDMDRMFENDI